MHEVGIANEIIRIINDIMGEHPGQKVDKVKVVIGEMIAVVPDSLTFAYTALTENTLLQNSKLDIEIVPLTARCNVCSRKFNIKEFEMTCPYCFSQDIAVNNGNELYIKELEVS
ncbi:hydrogenase maturation nickel metallochaperone HypA [candidate division KSB1 bacterium]|nr:hydrogenase maturation nickel metallochaperone HypA [candidate division KSB1 bacterium]